jgi:hypothetical protein
LAELGQAVTAAGIPSDELAGWIKTGNSYLKTGGVTFAYEDAKKRLGESFDASRRCGQVGAGSPLPEGSRQRRAMAGRDGAHQQRGLHRVARRRGRAEGIVTIRLMRYPDELAKLQALVALCHPTRTPRADEYWLAHPTLVVEFDASSWPSRPSRSSSPPRCSG